MTATMTGIVITGLTPETTEATLICHRLVCQKASNERSAFGTKYQRRCTCEKISEGGNNHPSPRTVNNRPIYALRAITEERHLSRDPDYVAYCDYIAKNGAVALLKRLFATARRSPMGRSAE
ncbi:hypothetical protein NKI56_28895 [Mesorhizobium sp. M0622]|uniref:hypothetical protein n=1 Tax=Mesorhizobium sp. M0622 TaxID=2956975 RepID=UPI003338580E